MNYRTVVRLIGILIVFTGVSMSFSLFWSLYLGEPDAWALFLSVCICLACGGGLFLLGSSRGPVLRREATAVVGLGWLLAAGFGALPFYLSGAIPEFVDAYFETMSGFTTAGSSILTDIEALPKGVLFWRSFTHWLGGMGIVVLFVAVLPYLRAGGKQLFQSEVPGPTFEVLHPRIRETALALWKIYVGLSAAGVLLLYLEGMTFYDALCHLFGTLATGGFSTKNTSVGHYDSALIDVTITLFMILGGANFGLYFYLLRGRWKVLWEDVEWRFYMGVIGASVALVTVDLMANGVYADVFRALRYAAFQVVSMLTCTGFATTDFDGWPSFSRLLLVAVMFAGGCAGSTSGGIKQIRILLTLKNARLETEKILRPRLVQTLKIRGVAVEDHVRDTVGIFIFLYLFIALVCSMALTAMGQDLVTAVTAVAATLNTAGPGLAAVGPAKNFAGIPDAGKIILAFCMVLGRLELFAVLLLFTPSFWRGR